MAGTLHDLQEMWASGGNNWHVYCDGQQWQHGDMYGPTARCQEAAVDRTDGYLHVFNGSIDTRARPVGERIAGLNLDSSPTYDGASIALTHQACPMSSLAEASDTPNELLRAGSAKSWTARERWGHTTRWQWIPQAGPPSDTTMRQPAR